MNQGAGLDRPKRRLDLWKQLCENGDLIAGEHKDRRFPAGKILLMAEVLVGCHQNIDSRLSTSEQFTVLDSGPTHFLNC